jgi:hypothetical protein
MNTLFLQFGHAAAAAIGHPDVSPVRGDLGPIRGGGENEAGGQGKNVAAVLAAAVFEDSIRRLGAAHAGTVGGEKLAIGGESTSAYFSPST